MTDAPITEAPEEPPFPNTLPCPLCGEARNVGAAFAWTDHVRVRCYSCRMEGPHADDIKTAVERWSALPRRDLIEAATEARVRAELAEDVAKARAWDRVYEILNKFELLIEDINMDHVLAEARAKLGLP